MSPDAGDSTGSDGAGSVTDAGMPSGTGLFVRARKRKRKSPDLIVSSDTSCRAASCSSACTRASSGSGPSVSTAGLDTGQVLTGAGVDLDDVALVDEQRHGDDQSGLNRRRLVGPGG